MTDQKSLIVERQKLRWMFLEQLYWKSFATRTNISIQGTKEEIYAHPDSEMQRAITYLHDKKWIDIHEFDSTEDFPHEISIFITALGMDVVEETLLKRES
ncbi:hypothetical protein [Paenibacillus campi]|uniref:hypothetical protein n=1 Tax=Paenibacillus campi TaxID=3106031 RepID=UPI002AFEE3E0|nr:hypothetical protein [Paenibacillus sp. SGZ-1009]